MTLNKKIIEDLKNIADIVSIISEYINLERKGANYIGLCPFHADSEPSFYVSNKKKIFKCFSCNEGGDVIFFVQKIEKKNFVEAIKIIANKSNFNNPFIDNIKVEKNIEKEKFFEINKQANFLFKKFLYMKENKNILDYLYSRGLDDDSINFFNIGFAPNKKDLLFKIMTNYEDMLPNKNKDEIWNQIDLINNGLAILDSKNNYQDFFKNRIIFPITDKNDNILGFSGRSLNQEDKIKYLNSKTHEYFQKDSLFFNMKNALKDENEKIYLTEGFFDVISCFKNGYKNVIGLMGTNFSKKHLEILQKSNCKSIILAMDNDSAGIEANIKIGEYLFNSQKVIMVLNDYPKEYKDLNLLSIYNSKKFNEYINSYIFYIEYYINKSFEKIDMNSLDEKITILNKLEDFIANNADENLISYYAEILSKKTSWNYEDIRNKIYNKINFINNVPLYNEDIIFQNSVKNINYSIKIDDMLSNKIFNFERTLLILMILDPKITKIFKDKLNYLILDDNNDYANLKKIILISFEINNNYNYINIIKTIENSKLNILFKKKIIDEILLKVNEIENIKICSMNDIFIQGEKIINELIKIKEKKNIHYKK